MRGFQSPEAAADAVRKLLESSFWLPTLRPRTAYRRRHDDHDGKLTGSIQVVFGEDADAWVLIDGEDGGGLRFRTYHGGGQSLRVRNALHILAEAIRLDNEECPQRTALETGESREQEDAYNAAARVMAERTQRDAERYRYLRAHVAASILERITSTPKSLIADQRPEALDAEIDARSGNLGRSQTKEAGQ